MPFPSPPAKITPFGGPTIQPYDIGRQFDEHSRSINDVIEFLRTIVRDDGRLKELANIEQKLLRSAVQPDLPTGVLGPNVGGPQGTDAAGAAATAQDWSQVSIEWAEHMPDTIPPNILAMTAITGQHWSSRWWATKAMGGFGAMVWWYMGAWPDPGPPTTPFTETGDPIPVGALYFNTTHNVLMVWNGSTWVSTLPGSSKTITKSLYYHATAGQTVFPLTTNDFYGHNFTYSPTNTEGTQVFVAGDRVEPTAYSINVTTSTVTLTAPVTAGTVVVFDILTPPSEFAAGICLVNPITPDGTTTSFTGLTIVAGGTPVNTMRSEELFVSVDGVWQEPVFDYSATGASVTFTTPPAADSLVFMLWFGPTASGTGGGGGGGGGGGASVVIGDTPPGAPHNGDLWFDTVGGNLFIWYTDPTSSQWVIVVHPPQGIQGAPGVQGPAGAASTVPGPAGAPGATGPQGPPGNPMTSYGQVSSVFVKKTGIIGPDVGSIYDTTHFTGLTMVNYGGTWQVIGAFAVVGSSGEGYAYELWQRYL